METVPGRSKSTPGHPGVFDHVIAVGQGVQNAICQEIPSTVIYNGSDAAHISRSQRGANSSTAVSATMTSWEASCDSLRKNAPKLIEAVSRLPERFKLLLVGWGPLRQRLLDGGRVAPGVARSPPDSHLGDYYRAMDGFCLASQSKGSDWPHWKPCCGLGHQHFAPVLSQLLLDRVHCVYSEGCHR